MTPDAVVETVAEVVADVPGDYDVARPAFLGVDYVCVVERIGVGSLTPVITALHDAGFPTERGIHTVRVFKSR